MRPLVLAVILSSAACVEGDQHLDITFDVCQPIVVVPSDDALPDEIDSIDDAIALWNATGVTQLSRAESAGEGQLALPVRFQKAILMFYGAYDDEAGEVVINRHMQDRAARAIVIAHELGHAFGLWHVKPSTRVSVMNPGNLGTPPTGEDAAAVASAWGPCDSRMRGVRGVRGARGGPGATPASREHRPDGTCRPPPQFPQQQ